MTSELGGSVTAPKSQNAGFAASRLSLSTSNAPKPPDLLCIPTSTRGRGLPSRSGCRPARLSARTITPCRRRPGSSCSRTRTRIRPASSPAHCPVAARRALLGRQPFRPDDGVVTGVDACVEQREHRQRRVRDGRLAGLERRPSVSSIVKLSRPSIARARTGCSRVAECMQRDDRPDARRLDPPQEPSRSCRSTIHAPLSSAPAFAAARPAGGLWPSRTVDEDEDLAPEIRRDRRGGAAREHLVDPEPDRARGLERRDHRQRDDRLARPTAEGVDRERRARRGRICSGGSVGTPSTTRGRSARATYG